MTASVEICCLHHRVDDGQRCVATDENTTEMTGLLMRNVSYCDKETLSFTPNPYSGNST